MNGLSYTFPLSVHVRALKSHNYRLYFTGQSISLIGTWMQRVALNWLVYRTTHSVFLLGVSGFAGLFPTFLLSSYAGVITDRINKHNLLIGTQIASLVQAGLLSFAYFTGHTEIPVLIGMGLTLGIINAFDIPSRQSLMVDLVEDPKYLSNAIALNSSMVHIARMIGPAVAGGLLTWTNEGVCFLVNAFSFIPVLYCLYAMKLPKHLPIHTNSRNFVKDFKAGLDWVSGNLPIKTVLWVMAASSLIGMSYDTLVPSFVQEVLHKDARTFGLLNSCSGLGALIGAVYLLTRKSVEKLENVVGYAVFLLGSGILLFSIAQEQIMASIGIFIAGLGMMLQITATNTFIQVFSIKEMRGRVLSFYVMAFMGMQPFGSLLVGSLAHRIGNQNTLRGEGILCLAVCLLYFLNITKLKSHIGNIA